ncbi:MAG: 2-amino-4-hydroxy-6-hydroxymethyldihydropteridine diphosphokinase [Gammaproteobacteria bacterium]|jgi:2-amino-4-hydroxy-6-hydroxymethyldihydropteridine diphosphokinase
MKRTFVSIGSNVERELHVRRAIDELRERFGTVLVSQVYETASVGFSGDPFLNLVAGFDTDLELDELVDTLRGVETRNARHRTEKRYGPRTLDIEVLVFGDMICDEDPIELPRSEITRQAYVLLPLAELAPNAQHSVFGERYADMCSRLNLDTSGMHPVELSLGLGLMSSGQ